MSTPKTRKCLFYNSDTEVCGIRVYGDGGPCRCDGDKYDEEKEPCDFYVRDQYRGSTTIKPTDYADVRDIPVSRLVESDLNPRDHYDEAELNGMAADMKARGQEQNLVVRPHPDIEEHRDDFEIAFGSRRYRAARIANLKKLKCYVKHMDDKDFTLSMSMENHWHVPLTPLEQAKSLKNLVDKGFTQPEIAKFFSRSQPWVSNTMKLLEAPEQVIKLMQEGHLTSRHIEKLLPYRDYPIMFRIIDAINYSIERDGSISSRHLEAVIPNTIMHNIYDDEVVVLNIDAFPSSVPLGKDHVKGEVLDQYFDLTECEKGKDGCGDIHVVRDDHERESRYCLNKRCWKDKVNLAKQQHDKALEELEKKLEEKEQKKKKGKQKTGDPRKHPDWEKWTEGTCATGQGYYCKAGCDGTDCPDCKLKPSCIMQQYYHDYLISYLKKDIDDDEMKERLKKELDRMKKTQEKIRKKGKESYKLHLKKFTKFTHMPKEMRTVPEVEAAGETFPENGNEPACIEDIPEDLGFTWKINRNLKYVNCPTCKEAIKMVMKEQRAEEKKRKAEDKKNKEELRLKEEERLRRTREKSKKRKETEERDRVVQAMDDFLDSVTDTFSYLDQRDGDDPEIRIWKTILYHDVRNHWRDAVTLAMRRWDPTIKRSESDKAIRAADKLKGADIVLAIYRILFYQVVAMHKTMGVTHAKLKKEFPDAAKFYTRGEPVDKEGEG